MTREKTNINNEKLAAEEKLQACNQLANKRDVKTKSGINEIKKVKIEGGHKSRKPRKSRKSKRTQRVYSLDTV